MSDIKWNQRGEGEIVQEGGSITNTESATRYLIRHKNTIVCVKIRDKGIFIYADIKLKDKILFLEWKEFNERN